MIFRRRIIRRPRRKLEETPETIELRAQAKAYLPGRVKELADAYGFPFKGRVTIKHNVSNWGSCSSVGNINLNLNVMRLPIELQDYIIFHELCHLLHMDHGPEFHRLLESVCPLHKEHQARLKEYKLI